MFANRCCDNRSTVARGLTKENVAHNVAILVIQMRDRLVEKDEVIRLAEGANKRHTLLLAEGHTVHTRVELIADAQLLEQLLNLLEALVVGDVVLNLDILEGGQLTKELQILEEHADMALANLTPTLCVEGADILAIEEYCATIVTALTIEVAAKR